MLDRDDEDERIEAAQERRERRSYGRCQCGDDLPGRCPGPQNCPQADNSEIDGED